MAAALCGLSRGTSAWKDRRAPSPKLSAEKLWAQKNPDRRLGKCAFIYSPQNKACGAKKDLFYENNLRCLK